MAQQSYYTLKPDIQAALKQARSQQEPFPWGFGTGLLAGCLITLFGVLMQMDQFTIIIRAAVGGTSIGVVVALISHGMRALALKHDEEP